MPDMFGPSKMPQGVGGAGQLPSEKDILRVMYEAYPSPWIASLLGDDF
jgi:hypothetical protein